MGELLYLSVRLLAGTLYPAYRSFKAVKTKDVKVPLLLAVAERNVQWQCNCID